MTATAAGDPAPTGRRERKKQRTREALIDAAYTLFAEKGFEATTVEEIADLVDVSSRTFFRYFSSKEDVVLTFQEEQFAAMKAALAARPPDEPVITAMRNAGVAVMRASEEGEYGFDLQKFVCVQQMMESSPALFGRSLEHGQKKQAEITRIVAERMGVDPAADMRPHVAAGAASCAFRAAYDLWIHGDGDPKRLSELVDQVFALIEDGLNYPSAARP
ncbi:MAG TPA: TetR family transcriptional regulator [Streptosporangiaceae bacterium]|nr:TetR family transcriptional regulator [Streptosporangiaceae bacterium]